MVGLCARERRTGLGQWAGEDWAREGRGSGLLRRVHSPAGLPLGPNDRREREGTRKWVLFLFSKPNKIKNRAWF